MDRNTSRYLDIVRPVAALVVLLSHVSMLTGRLGFASSLGVQAVDIFFVLSGFVISYVVATKERDLNSYAINRAVRIFSVALPALALTIILDYVGTKIYPAAYDGPYQAIGAGLLVRCLLFINEQWHAHRFPGSNGPYWSLGFEVWYYIAFGAFVFTPAPWRWFLTAAILLFIGPKVALLFPLWLLGVATYRICAASPNIKPYFGWPMFLVTSALFGLYQMLPHPRMEPFINVSFSADRVWTFGQDYLIGLLFSVHLIGFQSVSSFFSDFLARFSRTIRWVAGSTFSIYLTHVPIMCFLVALSAWPRQSNQTVALLLVATPFGCFAFAEIFERRKDIFRTVFLHAASRFGVTATVRD